MTSLILSSQSREWLQLGKLNNSEKFAEFDQDTVEMMVKEGIRFAIEVVSQLVQKVIVMVAEWKMAG